MTNCPNCGAPVGDQESFCSNCGTKIDHAAPSNNYQPLNTQPDPQPAPQADPFASGQQTTAQSDPFTTPPPAYPQMPYNNTAAGSGYPMPHYDEPITVGNWVITLLLMAVPVVNLVLLFIWGFGGDAPETKSNWAKAQLIIMAIAFVASFLLAILMGIGMAALVSAF